MGVTSGPGRRRRGPWMERVRSPRRAVIAGKPRFDRNRFRENRRKKPRLVIRKNARRNKTGKVKKGGCIRASCPTPDGGSGLENLGDGTCRAKWITTRNRSIPTS